MPGHWHAALSVLTMDARGVSLGSQFRWTRLLAPKWSAEYVQIRLAEAVDIGTWKAFRIYKTGSRLACCSRRGTRVTYLKFFNYWVIGGFWWNRP